MGLKLMTTTVTAIRLIDILKDSISTPAFVSIPDSTGDQEWSELRQLQNATTYRSDDGPFVRIEFDDERSIDYPYDMTIAVVLAETT
jgi:hypothetical protein